MHKQLMVEGAPSQQQPVHTLSSAQSAKRTIQNTVFPPTNSPQCGARGMLAWLVFNISPKTTLF